MRLCRCVLLREFENRMNRSWRGISKAPRVQGSPLLPHVASDVWVTCSEAWLKSQVRHIAYRQPLLWEFRVSTDADLLTAWLATAATDGAKIYDADVARSMEEGERRERPSFAYMTLTDIAIPSDLLILKLGVKSTPNREMANTLLECILMRQHAGKATWVWDQAEHPLDAETHRCHSFEVLSELSTWERVREGHEAPPRTQVHPSGLSFFGGAPSPGSADVPPTPAQPLVVDDVTPESEEEPASETHDEDSPFAGILNREPRAPKRKKKGGFHK